MSQIKFQKRILADTEKYIRKHFENDGSGHDWWHIFRVKNLALKIAEKEGGDFFIIEMAALLHDLDDWKLNDFSNENKTELWLNGVGLEESIKKRIVQIISEVSFKGAEVETKATTTEAKIVQDADRLDAIGAIGIARTFAYGGSKNRLMYDPGIDPVIHTSFDDYKKNTAPTINHFYEKLLLLKDLLNTKTAQKLAEKKHSFMEEFLTRFFDEWNNKI